MIFSLRAQNKATACLHAREVEDHATRKPPILDLLSSHPAIQSHSARAFAFGCTRPCHYFERHSRLIVSIPHITCTFSRVFAQYKGSEHAGVVGSAAGTIGRHETQSQSYRRSPGSRFVWGRVRPLWGRCCE